MAAYVVAEITINNEEMMKEYRPIAAVALAKHGGRILALGTPETLEGAWQSPRMVVVEFPDIETARRWFASPEYAPAKAIRSKAALAEVLVLDGVKPA
jgi:uncharacterized protein (DUF1330 family)